MARTKNHKSKVVGINPSGFAAILEKKRAIEALVLSGEPIGDKLSKNFASFPIQTKASKK